MKLYGNTIYLYQCYEPILVNISKFEGGVSLFCYIEVHYCVENRVAPAIDMPDSYKKKHVMPMTRVS